MTLLEGTKVVVPMPTSGGGPLEVKSVSSQPTVFPIDRRDSGYLDKLDHLESLTIHDLETEAPRPYPLPPRPKRNTVLQEDLKTPDNHVERDPRLIRLTGVHPFNVEAPLSDLYDEGFLTTKDLHYVRNHGAVPQVEDAEILDWEFTIEGMVERPVKMRLRDLVRDYEQLTYPITLVCAGNRRKEQNVVRKTKGFSWGAAGVSTALWTGVALGELLTRAGLKRGAKFVCFEGADKLPNGYYGTSVKLSWAMDPERGIMVSYKMNGELLHPDHGKPLRIVIPGQIGGRSVKWLKRIIVSSAPSDNWYHIYDNRVLPTMVSPEASAHLPDTWKDERYAIYDLSTNSAICYPAHNESVSVEGSMAYKLKGYAYSGGGRRVGRLEVTLDQGKTWSLANITYPEDQYRLADDSETLYGGRVDISWRDASFCWCFWELDVSISLLQDAGDIMIRAMDDSMNVQPRDLYWSVLGMMNNPWYRVVIHREQGRLRFEHPTQPALIPGGWMERVKKDGGDLTNGFWGDKITGDADAAPAEEPTKDICMVRAGLAREISVQEFRDHSSEERPWFVVNGQVYDGTAFLEGHPGGAASITGAAGQDVTEEFMSIHSDNAKAMMKDYHIGSLPADSLKLLTADDDTLSTDSRPVFLRPKAWSSAVLGAKESVSHDTRIFTFALDHAAQTIGLPVGQHLMMRLRDPVTDEAIIRAYTPISEPTDAGRLRILIKIYEDRADAKGGRMTQALDALPLGRAVDFKGPVGRFVYLGRGRCAVNGRDRHVARFIMVCAGSGVTPIFQVLRAVMEDEGDETECLVLDGNREEGDILLKKEIDALVERDRGRCRVLYTLSKPSEAWTGLKGRLDRALFEREVGQPPAGGDAMVMVCGPGAMEEAMKGVLKEVGWSEEDVLFF